MLIDSRESGVCLKIRNKLEQMGFRIEAGVQVPAGPGALGLSAGFWPDGKRGVIPYDLFFTHPATWLAGYIPDLPTPFGESGAIDLAAFERLCERQINAGVIGGRGRRDLPAKLNPDAGRTGKHRPRRGRDRARPGLRHCRRRIQFDQQAIELARRAAAARADAVLSVVPYYNKPMQSGIYAHFRRSPARLRCPSSCTTFPPEPSANCPTKRWRGSPASKQFIGLRDDNRRCDAPDAACGRCCPRGFRLMSGDDATALAFIALAGMAASPATSNVAPDLCR